MPIDRGIMLVDDHPLIRLGLRNLLDNYPGFSVVAEAATAAEAAQLAEQVDPDVAVIDLNLPDGSGIDLIRRLRKDLPHLQILVLSLHESKLYAAQCRRAGADGYLMKESAALGIIEAVQRVIEGKGWEGMEEAEDPRAHLSRRELQVMEMLGHGHPPRKIAEQLGLSIKTVETHLAHCKQKLGVQHQTELLRLAIAWGDGLEGREETP